MNISALKLKADEIRKNVVDVAVKNGAGHIAPSLSCIDILTALYFNILNLPQKWNGGNGEIWEQRDRVVFSKAHGCYGLYAILADLEIIPSEYWTNFYKDSPLTGCVERHEEFALEAGCGSLGHGLPMAVGLAFGFKMQAKSNRVYCIVGDGEMQEGSCWEAIQFASKHNLGNLTLIIDDNHLQAMDATKNVLTNKDSDIFNRLKAFGFDVKKCNGHDMKKVFKLLEKAKNNKINSKPVAIVADTVKGYGLKCMENVAMFHFRIPTQEELKQGARYE